MCSTCFAETILWKYCHYSCQSFFKDMYFNCICHDFIKNCMSVTVFWISIRWFVFWMRKKQIWTSSMDKLLKIIDRFSVRNFIKIENFTGIFELSQQLKSDWLFDLLTLFQLWHWWYFDLNTAVSISWSIFEIL